MLAGGIGTVGYICFFITLYDVQDSLQYVPRAKVARTV